LPIALLYCHAIDGDDLTAVILDHMYQLHNLAYPIFLLIVSLILQELAYVNLNSRNLLTKIV